MTKAWSRGKTPGWRAGIDRIFHGSGVDARDPVSPAQQQDNCDWSHPQRSLRTTTTGPRPRHFDFLAIQTFLVFEPAQRGAQVYVSSALTVPKVPPFSASGGETSDLAL